MSKIICDVCGTRYPDTAEQCPICGYAKGATVKADEELSLMDYEETQPRQKVSGGRFSKSNVKKRNEGTLEYEEAPVKKNKPVKKVEDEEIDLIPMPKAKQKPEQKKPAQKPEQKKAAQKAERKPKQKPAADEFFAEDDQNKKVNTILNILLVIVIVALLAVTAYIFTQYVLPEMRKPEPTTAPTVIETEPTEPPVTEEPTYPCEELFLEETEIILAEYGQKWLINVDVRPANTTDELTFSSASDLIATVDSEGCVTAMAEGQTVITITCGNVQVKYDVYCIFPGVEINPGYVPTDPPPTEPPEEWTVVSKTVVNVRSGPSKDYDRVRQCKNGDKVYVYEIKEVKEVPWGRLEDGWICLSYAKKSE